MFQKLILLKHLFYYEPSNNKNEFYRQSRYNISLIFYQFNVCSTKNLSKVNKLETIILTIQMYKMPFLIIVVLLLSSSHQAVTSWTQTFNRYLITNQQTRIVAPTTSILTHTYTSLFPYIIDPISKVYFSTSQLSAEPITYPGYSNCKNLIYNISANSFSPTYLQTTISGYYNWSYYDYISYRYLITTTTDPLQLNNYLVFQQLQFDKSTQSQTTALLAYNSSNTIAVNYFIWDISLTLSLADLASNANSFYSSISYSISPSQIVSTINMSPYLLTSTSSSLVVRYLAIFYDATAIQQKYVKYKFESQSIANTASSYIITFTLAQTNLNTPNVAIFGLQSLSLNLLSVNYFYFRLQSTGTNFFTTRMYTFNSVDYTYNFFVVLFYDCQIPYFYFNYTDLLCYDTCGNGFYFDYTTLNCTPCRYDCLTCYDATQCTSCNTAYRQLSGNNCTPKTGYYDSGVAITSICTSPCATCSINATNCTSCISNAYLIVSGNCKLCSSTYTGCQTCNSSGCLLCLSTYRQINQTYCNVNCPDTNCLVCNNSNPNICFRCRTAAYQLSTAGFCEIGCGTGILLSPKQCDDGNLINHDGCASDCTVEPDYICSNFSTSLGVNFTGYCSYTKSINFTIITQQKLVDSNRLQLLITVDHYQEYFWKQATTLDYYFRVKPVPFKNMKASFINHNYKSAKLQQKLANTVASAFPQSSLALVTFQYLQSIQSKNITLILNFSASTDPIINLIPPSQTQFLVNPSNNQKCLLYSSSIYNYQQKMIFFLSMLAYFSWFLFLVSLIIGSKRITAENLVVFQTTWASIIALPKLSPLFAAFTSLSPSASLFNMFFNTTMTPFQDQLTDDRGKGSLVYSQFIYNYNLAVIFILFPIIIGILLVLFSKIIKCQEERMKKIKTVYQRALGEYTFSGLILSGCPIAVGAALQFKFGMQQKTSTMGMLSFYLPIILLFILAVYGILRLKLGNLFGQFKKVLIENDNYSLFFQIILFYLGPAIGAILIQTYLNPYVNGFVMLLTLLLIILSKLRPIFKRQLDKHRVMFNLMAIFFIQAVFLWFNLWNKYDFTSDNDIEILMPLTIVLILSVNLFINFVYFIYETIKKVQVYLAKKNAHADEKQEYDFNHSQIYKQQLIDKTPITILQHKVRDRFIEESQKSVSENNDERTKLLEKLQQINTNIEKTVQEKEQQEQSVRKSKYKYAKEGYTMDREYNLIDQL